MAPRRLIIAAVISAVVVSGAANAANYRHPYSNVNPRNDAGNNTGDAVTDQLNNLQLQRPGVVVIPTDPAYPTYPGYYARTVSPPPRYYTPPPGYVVAPAYPAYGYGW